ncbi:GlxA family transcriptional regulator [Ciceribacter ferrooxidans]|uniref:GlxA family transcriptional regulator n=1 Tax=Ciceribacter ferrooxidans TaxID=2509717 RepID=A0A4Q2S7D5_9HYPH|nr:GlxA family transcriptional regulator [Ciceribacter ferrooxidans]RYB98579.1 GlxA family transcriptional regulator [Ciceribacter ferrooxidans]
MNLDIAFLVFPQFQLLDLSGPLAVFNTANHVAGPNYRTHVLSRGGGPVSCSAGVEVGTVKIEDHLFDTLFVVGGEPCRRDPDRRFIADAVRRLAGRARRIASVCTGAFVLAEAGCLDGRSVTTHWRHVSALQASYPKVRVNPNPLFVKDGPIWTSTGTNAGIDLSLAMVEEDLGLIAATRTAQNMVVHRRRPGGQAQFAEPVDIAPSSERLKRAYEFARLHLHHSLSLGDLAEVASLSPRQFSRAFHAETGLTPTKAVERLRGDTARLFVETSDVPMDHIADKVGFADVERMRRAFLRLYGKTPQTLRREAKQEGRL